MRTAQILVTVSSSFTNRRRPDFRRAASIRTDGKPGLIRDRRALCTGPLSVAPGEKGKREWPRRIDFGIPAPQPGRRRSLMNQRSTATALLLLLLLLGAWLAPPV